MFKRKNPRPWYGHAKEWVWPSSGWGRTAQYLGHRVARIPDTPASIAAGLAFGTAVSFTPFIGLHLAFSIGIAWAARVNLVAAAIGTLLGNPWTFPFIWLVTYKTGAAFLGLDGGLDISEWKRHLARLIESAGTEPEPYEGFAPWALWEWRRVSIPQWRQILEEAIDEGDSHREKYARWMLWDVLFDPEYDEDQP